MVLREARVKFTYYFTKLVLYAKELGFEPAYDEITNHQNKGHKENSLHYVGLAGDLLLYKDKDYLQDTRTYEPLGVYWESLDTECYWGGRFGDGNHFSYAPKGIVGNRR